MKRCVSYFSLLVLLLALAGTASVSATGSERATHERGFDLGFDGKYRHGKPVKVKNFTFSAFTVDCDEGSKTDASATLPAMKVKRRAFGDTFKDQGMKTAVTGKYNKALTKVKGTLRVRGKVNGLKGCDSGVVEWVTN